jgi:hypothetical protein
MVAIRGHARRWGAYAALGIAVALSLSAGAETIGNVVHGNSSKGPASHQDYSAHIEVAPLPPIQPCGGQAVNQTHNTAAQTCDDRSKTSDNGDGFWNAKFTDWAIVALTAALVGVGVAQVVVYVRQARLMRAALRATSRSNRVANKVADAAIEANQINRDSLAAEHRPWVSIQCALQPMAPQRISGGFGYYLVGSINNHGRAPALQAFVSAEVHCEPIEPVSAEMAYCMRTIASRSNPIGAELGQTVFPDIPGGFKTVVAVTSDDIDRHKTFGQDELGNQLVFMSITILVCVSYKAGSSQKIHYTPYIFNINRVNDDGEIFMYEIDPGPTRPQRVGLVPYPMNLPAT